MSTERIARIDRKIKALQQQRELLVATANLDLWDRTPGYEVARRAIEVAAVGDHSICFLAEDMHGVVLAALATQMGVRATYTPRCYCGHYDNPYRQCVCTLAAVRRFHSTKVFQTKLRADMVVNDLDADCPVLSRYPPEPRTQVLRRIAEARSRNAVYVESTDVQQFLRTVQSAVRLSDSDIGRVLSISVTIARLTGLSHPGLPEVCEAAQYQTRRGIVKEL